LTSDRSIAYDTNVADPRVVLDTNVLVSAARSKRGASAKVLSLVGKGRFEILVSVPLLLEYEAVLLRDLEPGGPEWQVRTDILDYLCAVAGQQEIFFLWRPQLRDPKDEMVLEVAVAGGCDTIVSFNKKDLAGATLFNIAIRTPQEFLQALGALS
jgi:putative PIN family toxin of toxin-antitoxin system